MKRPRRGSVANACTDESTPERTRKVPSSESEKARIASSTVQFLKLLRFSVTASEWISAVADQPRHERGVLDRIPEPPAAPAELVVGPGAAEGDADGEEDPGRGRPRPRPARPGGVEVAADQRRDGERERDREADVAHVEHRRMDHHARILQQRIEVAAFGAAGNRRSNGFEVASRNSRKPNESSPITARMRADHLVGQVAAEGGDRERPERQHQQPEQDRAFVAAPDGGDAVVQRQRAVRVGGDVEHREVVVDEAERQADEGERDQREQQARRRPRQRHPVGAAARRAEHRHDAEHGGDAERDPEREVAELGNHGQRPARCRRSFAERLGAHRLGQLRVALLRALQRLGGFGRHVVLVVLGEHLAGDEHVALQLALGDDALALLEEVGKDAFVARRRSTWRCR